MDTETFFTLLEKSFSKINEFIPYVNRTPSKVFIEKLEELMKMGPRRLRYLRLMNVIPTEFQIYFETFLLGSLFRFLQFSASLLYVMSTQHFSLSCLILGLTGLELKKTYF